MSCFNECRPASAISKAGTWGVRWATALRNCIRCAAGTIVRFKSLAPYALMELILPGGSVMALLLWLYRRRRNGLAFGGSLGRLLSILKAIVSTTRHLGIGWV
jgi:hypothetical protein